MAASVYDNVTAVSSEQKKQKKIIPQSRRPGEIVRVKSVMDAARALPGVVQGMPSRMEVL